MPHPNGILKLDCKSGLFFLKIITERQVGTYCTNLETTLIAAKIANEPTKEPYKPNAKVIIPVIIIAIYGTSFEFLFAMHLGINPSFASADPLLGVPIDAATVSYTHLTLPTKA